MLGSRSLVLVGALLVLVTALLVFLSALLVLVSAVLVSLSTQIVTASFDPEVMIVDKTKVPRSCLASAC